MWHKMNPFPDRSGLNFLKVKIVWLVETTQRTVRYLTLLFSIPCVFPLSPSGPQWPENRAQALIALAFLSPGMLLCPSCGALHSTCTNWCGWGQWIGFYGPTTNITCILIGFPGAEKEWAKSQSWSFISFSTLFPPPVAMCTFTTGIYETAGHDGGCDHSY